MDTIKQGDTVRRKTHPKEIYLVKQVKDGIAYTICISKKSVLTWEFWLKDIEKEITT